MILTPYRTKGARKAWDKRGDEMTEETREESLFEKQVRFTKMVARLIDKAYALGYQITFGETWRSPEEARRRGFPKSLHTQRLAIDLNLFRNGVYLRRTEDHKELGEWWESIGGAWGGRFNDGNHYSLPHGGVK